MKQRPRTSLALPVAVLLACAAPASAGQQAAPPGPTAPTPDPPHQQDIIVTGRRAPDKAAAEQFARSVTQDLRSDEPVPRFFQPVCFAAAGLSRSYLAVITQRMAVVAREAGVALAGDGCRPNVLVQFVEDGAAEMAVLRKREPWMFDGMESSDIRKAIAEPGPAHAWSISGLRNSDGMVGPVREASFLVLTTRRDLFFSFVLIDRGAAVGRSLTQLADYAAMRSLARVRPQGVAGGDTILRLFAAPAADAPAGLTALDRAYLVGLYTGEGNLRSATKMHQIARAAQRDGEAPTDADPSDATLPAAAPSRPVQP